jgi:hypothetical protein
MTSLTVMHENKPAQFNPLETRVTRFISSQQLRRPVFIYPRLYYYYLSKIQTHKLTGLTNTVELDDTIFVILEP